jgi:hypothetical protein
MQSFRDSNDWIDKHDLNQITIARRNTHFAKELVIMFVIFLASSIIWLV